MGPSTDGSFIQDQVGRMAMKRKAIIGVMGGGTASSETLKKAYRLGDLIAASDWILNRIEIMRGQRFERRSLIFFGIILVLALITFRLIRHLQQGA